MKRVSFEKVAGDYVSRSGDEECHVCLSCNRPKLYLNVKSGLFYCARCHVRGRVVPRVCYILTQPTRTARELERINKAEELLCRVRTGMAHIKSEERETILNDLLGSRGIRWYNRWLGRLAFDREGIYFPLHLEDRTVGVHGYRPRDEVRYRTWGERGLWWSRSPSLFEENVIFIFEGVFDALSVDQTLYLHFDPEEHYSPVCVFTCGNALSESQLHAIHLHTRQVKIRKVFVAYDNDQLTPAVEVQDRLRLLLDCDVTRLLPPVVIAALGPFKDWDDIVRAHPDLAWTLLEPLIKKRG